jgi:hypothetical protein
MRVPEIAPTEPLHTVYILPKQLAERLFIGKPVQLGYLGPGAAEHVHAALSRTRLPNDFTRQFPKFLDNSGNATSAYWKGTCASLCLSLRAAGCEQLNFLMYVSPFILKTLMGTDQFDNWLLLWRITWLSYGPFKKENLPKLKSDLAFSFCEFSLPFARVWRTVLPVGHKGLRHEYC